MAKKTVKKSPDEFGKKNRSRSESEESYKAEKKSAPIDKDLDTIEKKEKKATRTKTKLNQNDFLHSIGVKTGFNFSPMLASIYDGSQSINGWYMSEKLDGVRAIWNGKSLYSRNGNKFYPAEFFTKDFPKDIWLDGELFLDRKKFSDTISIVKKKDPHDGWSRIQYLIFDAPKLGGSFQDRYEQLKVILEDINSPYLLLHQQEVCKNDEMLQKKMDEVVKIDGEGMIVRDSQGYYENTRSKSMLKVKRFHDAEAIVQKHLKGTGRLCFTMGAIEVINNDGITFKIGSGFTDKERSKPPKIGSVVTYRYFELSKDNVPRFPTFVRVHPGL